MDVLKCWTDLCDAFDARQRQQCETKIDLLLGWISDGGDPPPMSGVSNRETAAWMTKVLCQRIRKRLRDAS